MTLVNEKWLRIAADFASRQLGVAEDRLGRLKPARRKKIRSYYHRRAIDKKTMAADAYQSKYADLEWMPDEIKTNPELC